MSVNHPPHSCCAPSAEPRAAGDLSVGVATLDKAGPVCHHGMLRLGGGTFLMGSDGPETWQEDGEGPRREITLSPFWIDECTVTNQQFAEFVGATGFTTEAERFGWSFVHHSQLSNHQRKANAHYRVASLEWWYRIDGADWRRPLGTGQDFQRLRRADHPVTHLTWNDAEAYAKYHGKRLPTEAEWEFACRGGLEGKLYPWGDELTPGGKHRCNIWQGKFPVEDRGDDGYKGTAPARSFKPNGFGLYNMTGNVWEWVDDRFGTAHAKTPLRDPRGPSGGDRRVMRGGFLSLPCQLLQPLSLFRPHREHTGHLHGASRFPVRRCGGVDAVDAKTPDRIHPGCVATSSQWTTGKMPGGHPPFGE